MKVKDANGSTYTVAPGKFMNMLRDLASGEIVKLENYGQLTVKSVDFHVTGASDDALRAKHQLNKMSNDETNEKVARRATRALWRVQDAKKS